MQQLQTEGRDEEKEEQSEEIKKEEKDIRIADESAEQTVRVSEVGVMAANTMAEETTNNTVMIEGLGLRRRRLQKSDTKHETVDKNEPQKVDKAEQNKRNTKDVEESSLDGISVILRRG
jgi:Lon protease-like protein